MVLKDSDLDLTLNVQVDDFNYSIYATSHTMKCFGCGLAGHLVRACPEKRSSSANGADLNEQNTRVGEGHLATEKDNAPVNGDGAGVDGAQPSEQEPSNVEEPEVTPSDQDVSSETVERKNDEPEVDTSDITDSSQNSDISAAALDETSNDVNGDDSQNIETDVNPFKVPKGKKRARARSSPEVQTKKRDVQIDLNSTDAESESESECNLTCSLPKSGFSSREYSVEDIKSFLTQTKNAKNVKVDDYFPDIEQFMEKTRLYMAERKFTDKEGYRLCKFLTKLRALLNAEINV